jgi:hypothetical protein
MPPRETVRVRHRALPFDRALGIPVRDPGDLDQCRVQLRDKGCKTGETLWTDTQQLSYSPQASNSGNPLADLIAQAVLAAIEKGAPNYIPLAQQANAVAAGTLGKGVPAGPYLPNVYRADLDQFPVSAQ